MITIGAKPDATFAEPLQLLSECHRRIERFLAMLLAIAQSANGRELTAMQRKDLNAALHYFRQAAPIHTQDEETSLFPRMRETGDAKAAAALAALDALEADHRTAEGLHAEVDLLCRAWLTNVTLAAEQVERLIALLNELHTLYSRHIALEDTEVFPIAGKLLEPATLTTVGREMAVRRGLNPNTLPIGAALKPGVVSE